jgi:hypothetical protein
MARLIEIKPSYRWVVGQCLACTADNAHVYEIRLGDTTIRLCNDCAKVLGRRLTEEES